MEAGGRSCSPGVQANPSSSMTPAVERIQVTVLGVKGNQVRIGTNAPDDIQIMRDELLERL